VKNSLYIALAAAALLAGCAQPQTAEEFRTTSKKYPLFLATDSFEVDRPLSDVTKVFKERASECLNIRVSSTDVDGTSGSQTARNVVSRYTATVTEEPAKTELDIQQIYEKGMINVQKIPEKGSYCLVADAVPSEKNKTKITLYYLRGESLFPNTLKGWASGENMECPFQAKN